MLKGVGGLIFETLDFSLLMELFISIHLYAASNWLSISKSFATHGI